MAFSVVSCVVYLMGMVYLLVVFESKYLFSITFSEVIYFIILVYLQLRLCLSLLAILGILEMLEVAGGFAEVCPSVCSSGSCCRASRVPYPEVGGIHRF